MRLARGERSGIRAGEQVVASCMRAPASQAHAALHRWGSPRPMGERSAQGIYSSAQVGNSSSSDGTVKTSVCGKFTPRHVVMAASGWHRKHMSNFRPAWALLGTRWVAASTVAQSFSVTIAFTALAPMKRLSSASVTRRKARRCWFWRTRPHNAASRTRRSGAAGAGAGLRSCIARGVYVTATISLGRSCVGRRIRR
jgi:hypothetical protein